MTKEPLIVALEDGRYAVEAVVEAGEAERMTMEAMGAPVVRGLRIRRTLLRHMRQADDSETPAGLRSEPYYVLSDPQEPGAVACWLIDVDALNITIDPLLEEILRFSNGDLVVPDPEGDPGAEPRETVIVRAGTDAHARWERLFLELRFGPPPVSEFLERKLREFMPVKDVGPPT